jgi:hypothetical protein
MPRKKIIIDLGERFKNAFGYVAKNRSSNLEKSGFTENTGISNVSVFVNNNITFENLSLQDEGKTILFGYAPMSKEGGLGNIFAPPPMISFRKQKNITRTEIDGSDAEVVERYGDRSWEVTIQGLLIDMADHEYPSEQIKTLCEWFNQKKSFEVASQMFDDLGIRSIYMESFDVAGVQGFHDTVQYTIAARSIKDVVASFIN